MATVDNRVVEMKFDNAQFEQGVKQTISSLEQLKLALNLNTATTGLNALQSSFDSFKLDNIQTSVDTLTEKFSTLGIVGMTAIQNITNKVIDFASNKVTSAFNQIVTGGWSRASNIAQSRFTLSGLFGDELYDAANNVTMVEEAFNNASDAVDGTAYSLDSAVSVASQLSASGVEVGEQMEQVLKSISGVAAMTGDTYDGIGNIYTTVAGNGRLMGMQLTQLSTHGLNAAATIADYLNTTEAEVRDMVSKGEIDFQTFSDAMYSAFGEHAKDANKTFSGSMDNIKSALSRIGAIFSSGIIENDDLISFLNDVRVSINSIKKAIEPLEVPFKNLISTMSKVASGIVKSLDVTGFSKFIEYVAVGMDALTKWFEQFVKVEETIGNIIGISDYEFAKSGEAISSALQQATDFYNLLDDTQKALVDKAWDIWMGEYGNGSDRVAALGEEYEELQSIVDQTSGSIGSFSEFCEACYYILQAEAEATEKAGEETDKLAAKVENADSVMDAIFIAADGVKAVFSSIVNVFKAVKQAFTKVFTKNGFIKDLATVSGMFTGLIKTFEITDERAEKLAIIFEAIFSVIAMVKDIVLSLVAGIARKLNPAVSNLYDWLLDIMVAIAKVILKITTFIKENETLHTILGFLGGIIANTASKIKYFFEQFMELEAVQKIKDKLKSVGDYIGEKLSPIFESAQGYISNFFGEMSGGDTEDVDALLENVNDVLETFIGLCEDAEGKVGGFISSFAGIKATLEEFGLSAETLKEGVETVKSFNDTVKKSDSVTSFFDNLSEKFGGFSAIVENVGSGINDFVSSISDSIGKVLVAGFGAVIISLTMRLSSFVKALTGFVSSVASVPKAVGSSIKMVGEGIKKYFINKSKADLVKSYAIAIGVLAVALIALAMVPEEGLYRALAAMISLIAVFGLMVKLLTVIPKGMKVEEMEALRKQLNSLATVLVSFAVSIMLIALSLVVLTNNVKWENIKQAGITLALMMAAMIGVVAVLSKLATNMPGRLSVSAFAIIAVAGGVWLLAKALEELTDLNMEGIQGRVAILGELVLMMIGLLAISSLARFSGALAIIAMIASVWAIELTLKWLITNGISKADIEKNKENITVLMVSLLTIAFACRMASKNAKVGTALTILAFVYALYTLTRVLITLADVPFLAILKALVGIYAMVGVIALLFKALDGEKSDALKASVALLVISIAMAALIGLMKLLSFLEYSEIVYGMIVLYGLMSMFALLLYVCNFASEIKASTIWALTGAIAALVVMVTLMSLIENKDSLIESMLIVIALMLSMALSLYLIGQNADKINIKPIIAMIVAIAIIAAAVYAIASTGMPLSIVAAGVALAIVLLGLSEALSKLSENLSKNKIDKSNLKMLAELILLLVAVGAAIALVVLAISKTTADKAVIAIFAVVLVIAEVMYLMQWTLKNLKDTETTKNRLKLLQEMIYLVVAVGLALSVLMVAIGNTKWYLALIAMVSLGVILAEIAYLTKVIAEIKSDDITTKKLIAMAEIIVAIIAIAAALAIVTKAMNGASTSSIVGSIAGLILVLAAIAGFLAIVALIKDFSWEKVAAIAVMIFMMKSIGDALSTVLLTGADWKKMISAAAAMAIVLLSVAASLAILTAIGSTGVGIVAMLVAALTISVVLLAIAESIKIFSEAMYLMVEAVKMLSEINYDNIDTGKLWDLVKIMAAVSGIAILLVVILGMLSPLVAIVAVLSLVFAAAFAIVASNATDFLTALTYVIVSITSFIALIASLSTQMDTIKENIVGIGSAIGTGLATAISTFITTLANNIETIKESIKQIVVTIATTIGECAGVFAAAGVLIIFSFLQGFIETLNDSLPGIINSLAESVTIAINAIADAIYNNADAIQDAVQTLMDVLTVKIKDSGGVLSYLISDLDYATATLRLSEKMGDAGEEAGEAAGETTGNAITDTIDEKISGFDITSLGSENSWFNVGGGAGDTTSEGFLTSLTNGVGEFNIDDVLSTDQLTSDYGIDFSNLGGSDLSDQFAQLTNTTDTSMTDMADSNAEAYYNELDSEFSAAEYAQHGLGAVELDNSEEVYATQAEADANTYGDDYTDAINDYDGSGVAEGVASWTTSEEAVATLKQSGEDGADNWIQGFINGVYAMSADLRTAVINAINGNVVDATAEATDSASPSKKAKRFGKWWDMGFAGGVLENSYLMSDAITESFSGLDSDMESSLAHINAIVNNSLNYEPTITPVLDTTGLSEQAGWLDQTLDGQYSMSLAAQNQLEIDHANESSLARQIEDLRSSVQALANKDYSKILEGVNINVDASTNVDGKPLYSRASKHTIQVIDDQERSYIMAKGGRV